MPAEERKETTYHGKRKKSVGKVLNGDLPLSPAPIVVIGGNGLRTRNANVSRGGSVRSSLDSAKGFNIRKSTNTLRSSTNSLKDTKRTNPLRVSGSSLRSSSA